MIRRKLALFILSLFFSISLVPVTSAIASENNTISNEKLENIKINCDSIKTTIKRVQNSDRNLRVSLGRTYQQILSDFITPLNVRLVKNNRFDNNLNDIQNRFASTRDQFNRDYINYGQAIETLLAADCKNNPSDFYYKLQETRKARENVAKSVKTLQKISDEHISNVKKLRETFLPKTQEESNE